jgi:hypothetical protein
MFCSLRLQDTKCSLRSRRTIFFATLRDITLASLAKQREYSSLRSRETIFFATLSDTMLASLAKQREYCSLGSRRTIAMLRDTMLASLAENNILRYAQGHNALFAREEKRILRLARGEQYSSLRSGTKRPLRCAALARSANSLRHLSFRHLPQPLPRTLNCILQIPSQPGHINLGD